MNYEPFDFCGESACAVGVSFEHEFAWPEVDGSDVDAPIDTSAMSAKMQVRKSTGQPLVLELNTDNGSISLNGEAPEIKLALDSTATAALTPGIYRYDLDLTLPDARVLRVAQGLFVIVPSITD